MRHWRGSYGTSDVVPVPRHSGGLRRAKTDSVGGGNVSKVGRRAPTVENPETRPSAKRLFVRACVWKMFLTKEKKSVL